jgi:hypothetical protein
MQVLIKVSGEQHFGLVGSVEGEDNGRSGLLKGAPEFPLLLRLSSTHYATCISCHVHKDRDVFLVRSFLFRRETVTAGPRTTK